MTDEQFNRLVALLTELLEGIESVERSMNATINYVPEFRNKIESQNFLDEAVVVESSSNLGQSRNCANEAEARA